MRPLKIASTFIALATLMVVVFTFSTINNSYIYSVLKLTWRGDNHNLMTHTTLEHSCNRSMWPFNLPDSNLSVSTNPAISLTDCDGRLHLAQRAVPCEMTRAFDEVEDSSCAPQVRVINCTELKQSSLPCKQPFEYTVYNYHTQYHCLVDLAADVASRDINLTVPRVLHYVWFYENGEPLKFYKYLGLISTIKFQGTRTVFFWYDGTLPTGRWWHEFIGHLNQPRTSGQYIDLAAYDDSSGSRVPSRRAFLFPNTKIVAIYRRRPSHIYNNQLEHLQHKSDIVRMEALLLYGGLYIDADVVSLRDLQPLLTYQVTMGREDLPTNNIGNSIIFAARNAPYLYLWHHTYTTFNKAEWGEHSTEGNAKLHSQCPQWLHVEERDLLFKSELYQMYLRNLQFPSNYMMHLVVRIRRGNHPMDEPADLIDWNTTIGHVLRGIYFGTCEVCG